MILKFLQMESREKNHLFGVHTPYTMNENCEPVEENSVDREAQLSGIYKIISEYIAQMKEMGCYDNSTIIIKADYGGLYLYETPAVLVKMAGESRDAAWQEKIL